MSNPFDAPDTKFLVLVNEEGQHSLWPSFVEVPAGWTVAHGEDSKDACLKYVEQNWADMRPNSLVRLMNSSNA
ncbi:MbtH family protein [Streptomyces sp. CG1]|uniref:MbtH family protein n=1 Tax=Streptomyces sp. CG1 TaxID=1287523 RepID=UPI0034E2981A